MPFVYDIYFAKNNDFKNNLIKYMFKKIPNFAPLCIKTLNCAVAVKQWPFLSNTVSIYM